jgi:hypothetical protein
VKTIKVIGGGPLVGRTFYGEKVDQTETEVVLSLDELIHPQEKPRQVFRFNTQTGYLKVPGGETDLLRVV